MLVTIWGKDNRVYTAAMETSTSELASQISKCPLAMHHLGVSRDSFVSALHLVGSSFTLIGLGTSISFCFLLLPLSPSPSYFPVSSPCLSLSSSLFLSPGLAPPKPTKIAYSKGPYPLCGPHFLKGISSNFLPWNRKQTNFSVFSVIKILEKTCPADIKKNPQTCDFGFQLMVAGFSLVR